MTVFYHQRINRTRATSSWSDEQLMIEFAGASGNGQLLPTASRGLFNFCSSHAKALVCLLFSQLHHQLEKKDGQMLHCKLAEAPTKQTMASDTRGRKRFKHTLASRPFFSAAISKQSRRTASGRI